MKLIFLFLFPQLIFAQEIDQYLAKNKQIVNWEEPQSLSILNADLAQNELFLFGENHGAALPHNFDVMFFKKLYKEQNVRFYLAEVDPIKAWMLNNYMQDGNISWLKKVFKSWQNEGQQWANKSNFKKYEILYQFYKSLPKKDKFKIIGIDTIQDYTLLKEYIQALNNDKLPQIELIKQLLVVSDTLQYKNKQMIGALARKINQEMKLKKEYASAFKKNYDFFELLIKNAGYVGNKMTRDSIMYCTFLDSYAYLKLQNKKIYGFLGFSHTLQTSYNNSFSFATYLKRNNFYKNKMISLQMLALNTTVLLPYNEDIKKIMPASYAQELRKKNPDFPFTEKYIPYELSNDNFMMLSTAIIDLKKQSEPNTTTIYKLNNENSPYAKGKKLAEITGFQTLKMTKPTDSTLDAFQYVVLFRNSAAGIPILE